jgi:exodeoxyribonuclease VII small subunit
MTKKKDGSFEEKLAELTRIVDTIGRDDCPVDDLEAMVRRAVELIRTLRSRLSATEISVREVLAELEAEVAGDEAGDPAADDEDEEEEEED